MREDATGRPLRFRLKVWQGAGSYRELAEAVQAQRGGHRYSSARLDMRLDTLAVTMERDDALPLWCAYQHALAEEAPLNVLFYALGINGVRERLHGVADGDPRGPLATARSWWLSR